MDYLLTEEEIESELGVMLHETCYTLDESVKLARIKSLLLFQAKKIYGRGNEPCPHSQIKKGRRPHKRQCSICWGSLEDNIWR
jgi:hypothetical protein